MPSVDVTSKVSRLNGVNSDANYVHTDAYRLPIMTLGISGYGDNHPFAVLPKGRAITRVTVIALESVTSSGSATAQICVKHGSASAVGLHTAIGKANLAAGMVNVAEVAAKTAYSNTEEGVLSLLVGTADLTAGEILVLVDSIPVGKFLSNG